MMNTHNHILRIDSSAQQENSLTRKLANEVQQRLMHVSPEATLTSRDTNQSLPHINNQWLSANFTNADQRTAEQVQQLQLSDQLINELKAADTLLISAPIYNFSVPASLKAWIDLVCRANETFRYTDNGPEGLLSGKKAYLVMASGGVPFGSATDFASGYLIQVLNFIGITDVRTVYAEGVAFDNDNSEAQAMKQIEALLPHQAAA